MKVHGASQQELTTTTPIWIDALAGAVLEKQKASLKTEGITGAQWVAVISSTWAEQNVSSIFRVVERYADRHIARN